MNKVTIITAITLSSIVIPFSKPAQANPYQDANIVVNFCSLNTQNRRDFRACLNHGAMLIRAKYNPNPNPGHFVTVPPKPQPQPTPKRPGRVDVITPGYLLGISY